MSNLPDEFKNSIIPLRKMPEVKKYVEELKQRRSHRAFTIMFSNNIIDRKVMTYLLNMIALSGAYSYKYAIKKNMRFKRGERTIMRNSNICVLYAHFILKGRWKELEEFFVESPNYHHESVKDFYRTKILNKALKLENDETKLEAILTRFTDGEFTKNDYNSVLFQEFLLNEKKFMNWYKNIIDE